MPEERLTEYLDSLDAAMELHEVALRASLPVAVLARPRRMDLGAWCTWADARRRGIVTDIELAWHVMACRQHPASWIGYLLH